MKASIIFSVLALCICTAFTNANGKTTTTSAFEYSNLKQEIHSSLQGNIHYREACNENGVTVHFKIKPDSTISITSIDKNCPALEKKIAEKLEALRVEKDFSSYQVNTPYAVKLNFIWM